jgi:uncharacterized protein with HEPN domain
MTALISHDITQPLDHASPRFGNRQDRRSHDAVVRKFEIIGEAVAKISNVAPAVIVRNPEIPGARMRAMRNGMIHEYFFVDLRIIRGRVKSDLPRLRQQIDALLKPSCRCAEHQSA